MGGKGNEDAPQIWYGAPGYMQAIGICWSMGKHPRRSRWLKPQMLQVFWLQTQILLRPLDLLPLPAFSGKISLRFHPFLPLPFAILASPGQLPRQRRMWFPSRWGQQGPSQKHPWGGQLPSGHPLAEKGVWERGERRAPTSHAGHRHPTSAASERAGCGPNVPGAVWTIVTPRCTDSLKQHPSWPRQRSAGCQAQPSTAVFSSSSSALVFLKML